MALLGVFRVCRNSGSAEVGCVAASVTGAPQRGAFERGLAAAGRGAGVGDCPYADTRTADGKPSWARSFRNAWFRGLAWGKQQSLF